MIQTIHKKFWAWEFDKEEKWLNEMAAKGLCLVSVGPCKYRFENCEPGEYRICMQLLDKKPSHPEGRKYIEFLETTGAEHIASFANRWAYFRKKTVGGEFELFSDNKSRVKYLSGIIRQIACVMWLELFIGIKNFFMAISLKSIPSEAKCLSFFACILGIVAGILCAVGIIRLLKKRKRMKQESRLYE